LFDPRFVDNTFEGKPPPYPQWRSLPFVDIRSVRSATLQSFQNTLKDGQVFSFTDRYNIARLPWESRAAVSSGYSEAFGALPFSSAARKMMDAVRDIFGEHEALAGIHVRRGDLIHDSWTSSGPWRGAYAPEEVIRMAILRLHEQGRKIAIFCTDAEVSDRLYPASDSCVKFPALDFSGFDTRIVPDFLHILALSLCSEIVSTGLSAFSLTARNIGNLPSRRFDDILSKDEIRMAADLLLHRMTTSPGSFVNRGDLGQSMNYLLDLFLREGERRPFVRVMALATEYGIPIERDLEPLKEHPHFDDFTMARSSSTASSQTGTPGKP
jgi:hypothetical protein